MNATPRPRRRIAWVTGLRPEKAAYYEQLHANPMPGVNEMIKACHLQNVSVHKVEVESQLYRYCQVNPFQVLAWTFVSL